MLNAFQSEWLKLKRPGVVGTVIGAMAAFAALAAALVTTGSFGSDAGPFDASAAGDLNAAEGIASGLGLAAQFIGIVALVMVAWMVAREFGDGTIRNLLIRMPQRLKLAAGKFGALAALLTAGVVVAAGAAVIAAFAFAPGSGVDTGAWVSVDGLLAVGEGTGQLLLATLGWAAIGALLGVVLRSGALAVGVGLAWMLPVEGLLGASIGDLGDLLPGSVFATIAGGASGISYTTALLLGLLYAGAAAAVSLAVFQRHDVTG
ncbi:MAG: ABC transporter permease [Gaiellaceae bacterium]